MKKIYLTKPERTHILRMLAAVVFSVICTVAYSATKTATVTGNWSDANIWSPLGVPTASDDIIIAGGVTVTVDDIVVCNNLDLGNNTNLGSVLKIITAGKSLTVNGDLRMNPNNKGKVYVLDAGPGDVNIAGTFSTWETAGTSQFKIGSGSLSFTPAVAATDASHLITFTGAGSLTFNASFTDSENSLETYTGCSVNFYSSYTVNSTNADWTNNGTANFYSTGTITATKNILFNNVNIMSSAVTTMAAAAGAFVIEGNLVLSSSSSFTANDDFQIDGNFTNNGGTFSVGAVTITMNGPSVAINGSAGMTLPTLQVGKTAGANNVTLAISKNTTVSNLVLSAANYNRIVNIGSGVTMTVSGNTTLNQPTKNNCVSTVSVGYNTFNVNGNLVFTGTNNGSTRVCKVDVTGGTFNLDGTITWMSNNAVATEVISVTSGTINFASAVTMGTKSGTLRVTSGGAINFNSTAQPCFTFGGGTSPVFTTSSGSAITFAKGFTINTTPLTFANGSTVVFSNSATITPNATVTFGHIQINSGVTLILGGNIFVKGNWSNSGTLTPSTYTVTFNGGGTQTISRTGGETFYRLTAQPVGTTIRLMNDVMVTNTLNMNGASFNLNNYTLTIGNNAGAALIRTAGTVYGGILKRWWPATAITSGAGNYYGLFPVGTGTQYRPVTINTISSVVTAGYVSVRHSDAVTVTPVTYTDNGGSNIESIADMHTDITTSGVAGGTYNIDVKFTNLGSAGSVANLKLLTYTGGVIGSCGTHVTTSGTTSSPVGHRSGLTLSELNNDWVIGTNDMAATPMYKYVYSRKSGDWNDTTVGSGTWSYTPGGAGASCDCIPTSSGYAVVEGSHTVTVTTSTDSVMFVDVMSEGVLQVNATKTLTVGGNVTLFGTGTFNAPGTLKVQGELEISASTTASGDVIINGGLTVPVGVTYTQSAGSLTISGDINVNGTLDIGSGVTVSLDGITSEIAGTGSIVTASGGSINLSGIKTIAPDAVLTLGSATTSTTVALAADAIVNNTGSVTVYGNITGGNASSTWINNAGSTLNITGTLLSTGILNAETSPNTVNYNGNGAQTIKSPYTSYYVLQASNSGTKTISSDLPVDSLLLITGSAIVDESSYIILGSGGVTMSGTSELKLERAVEGDVLPELQGTYNLASGTVTINQTADSAVVREAVYYNLKLNGVTPYDIASVSNISNNLEVSNAASITQNGILTISGTFTHSTSGTSTLTDSVAVNGIVLSGGTLRDGATWYFGGQSINVTGSAGWNKNGGAFSVSDGTVYFSGVADQSLNGTDATQTFNNLNINKNGGTVTVTGSTTTLTLNGNMVLTGGTFDKGTAATINMSTGNWESNGGTFTPGSGTVNFIDTGDQAIQGSALAQTFNNVTVNKTSGTVAVGGSTASVTLNGNMTLTAGTLDGGVATFYMAGGNWTNNGGTFTPSSGTVSFTGSGAQAINGTAASQTFNHLTVNKSAGTLSVSGSTTSLTANGNITLDAGTFDKGTAANIYANGNWTNNGGTFTHGTGTVHFTGSAVQLINGSASAQSFHNTTINKSGNSVSIGGSTSDVNVDGDMTLTAGTLDGGTGSNIYMTAGNWSNNGGTFTPRNTTVIFNSVSAAQAINGSAAAQTFNSITVDKSLETLSIGGSTTALTLNGDMVLASGTFDKGTAANIYSGGNWTNNGGTFTYGTGTVHFNGTGSQEINGTASAQSFYNTTVNKSAGTLSFGGSTNTLNINNLMTLTAGNFMAGSSTINMLGSHWTNNGGTFAPGTGTVVFSNTAADQAINGTAVSQTFNNLTMNKSGYSLGAAGSTTTLDVNSNLTLTAGTFNPNTANALNVGGNFINNATYTEGSGTVTFNGSAAQSISGSTTTTFNNLTLNNASTGLTLNTPANVKGALTLTDGEFITSASNILTLTATASSSSGSTSSYVAGPMKKVGNTAFVFPVGKAGKWMRVKASDMVSATTEVTAEFFATPYSDLTSLDALLDKVSPVEYWTVDRTVTSDPVKITLYWQNASLSSIENCDFLTIAHFTGGQWQKEDATVVGGSVCTGNGTGSIEMDGTVSTFSPFGFGSFGGGGALPVELVSFDAVSKGEVVETNWVTAIEINNDYFTVERSEDGINFKEVGKVEGAGNSTVSLAYNFTDANPLGGVSYYRLKQTDYDGQFSYSNMVTVRRGQQDVSVSVYPNPTHSQINIQLNNTADAVDVTIFDQFGKLMYTNVYPSNGKRSANNIQLQVGNMLSAGIYFMNVTTNQTTFKEKLIIN